MKASARMPAVAAPDVGGVTISRHILDSEAACLAMLARRVGKRLRRWIREMPEHHFAFRDLGKVDDRGKPILEPIYNEKGEHIHEPMLPGEDFNESFRWYQAAVLGLLKEQRERAKLAAGKGAPPVDDATFEAQIDELARIAVLEMPKRELEALIRERAIEIPANEQAAEGDDPRLKL